MKLHKSKDVQQQIQQGKKQFILAFVKNFFKSHLSKCSYPVVQQKKDTEFEKKGGSPALSQYSANVFDSSELIFEEKNNLLEAGNTFACLFSLLSAALFQAAS